MPPRLTKRKKTQIDRFFLDESKFQRLADRASKKGRNPKGHIVHVEIGGKNFTLKHATKQALFRDNYRILFEAHRKAVASKRITPEHYTLRRTSYVYTTPAGTVMKTLPGIGSDTLHNYFKGTFKGYKLSPSAVLSLKKIKAFLKKNPGITLEKVISMERELSRNLHSLLWSPQSKDPEAQLERQVFDLPNRFKNFSVDLHGFNNIIVLGYNKKTKKFKIALLDQIYPGEEWEVERILKRKKAGKK